MKIKINKTKTLTEKADKLLWDFETKSKMRFAVGSPKNVCEYWFPNFPFPNKNEDKNIKIIPVNKDSIVLTTDEISIFLLDVVLKNIEVLEKNTDEIEKEDFKVLYRFNQFLLHILLTIYKDMKIPKEYVNNKEKITELKNILKSKKLEVESANTRFLLNTYKPVEETEELFNLFNDLVYIYKDKEEIPKDTIVFNFNDGVIIYNDGKHKFNRGHKKNVFKELWLNKRVIKKGILETKGKTKSMGYLAKTVGFVLNPSDLTKKKEKSFEELLRNINRSLKQENIPAIVSYEDKSKIQLIVNTG